MYQVTAEQNASSYF